MSRVIVILSIFYTALFATLSDDSFAMTSDVEFHKLDGVSDDFQSVTFLNSYTNAPIIVCVHNLSSVSEAEAIIRIRNRSASGFEIRVQRPVDDTHTDTKAQCIVAKEGKNTLPDGYEFEAYEVVSTDTSGPNADGWEGTGERVDGLLTLDHGSEPMVLGQVMSYNDNKFSTFWTYDCNSRLSPPTSSAMCVGKHIGETSDITETRKYSETLGYIVIETGSGSVAKTSSLPPTLVYYKAALGDDSIDGVSDNGGASYDLGYDYKIGVATQSAMDGADGGWAVLYGDDPFEGDYLDLAIEEDTTDGSNRGHTREQVAYWVFTDDPGYDWMEVQKISSVGSDWVDVNFRNTYTSPVAVCTYNLTSETKNDATVRMQNVGTTSMEIKLQHPVKSDDVSGGGDVYCIVMEEGNHTFDNLNIEAHKVDSDDVNGKHIDWDTSRMENVGYSLSYTNPVVLGQVMSYNNEPWTVFWSSDGDDRRDPPDKDGLYVGKHIGKEYPKYRRDETIGFIVGRAHEGKVNHVYYALARGGDAIRGVGDVPPYKYDLSGYQYPHYSYAVATKNAEDGGQGGWAVLYGTEPVSITLDLAIDEETVAGDDTRRHTDEQVAYWVFEPMPVIAIAKSSCVIEDPLNSTNPKRIPGATIRYAIEVNNTGPGRAEDVQVDDDLNQKLDETTATKPKVLSGGCGDCVSLSGGSESGDVNGSKVTVDFGTVVKGSETTPTQECGYFEVEIK